MLDKIGKDECYLAKDNLDDSKWKIKEINIKRLSYP